MLAYTSLTDMESHTGDWSQPCTEYEAADSEKDLRKTLSSVQNPRAEA